MLTKTVGFPPSTPILSLTAQMIGNTNNQQGTGKRRHSVRESGCSEQRRKGNRPFCAAILQVCMRTVCGGPQRLQGMVSPDNLKEQAALPALALPEALPLRQLVCFITETLRIPRTCPLVILPLTPATVRHVPSLKAELLWLLQSPCSLLLGGLNGCFPLHTVCHCFLCTQVGLHHCRSPAPLLNLGHAHVGKPLCLSLTEGDLQDTMRRMISFLPP